MKAQRLGVREVARRARLDPSFFSKVLAGKRSPPSDDRMLERLAVCLEMSPTALYVYAGRIPPACQAAFESPRSLAALEAGARPEECLHPAQRPAASSKRPAPPEPARHPASPARTAVSRNAWDTARPEKPRAAAGTPPDISDDLL